MKRTKPTPMKLVRIDDKTEIEVPENIPDDVARKKFLEGLQRKRT